VVAIDARRLLLSGVSRLHTQRLELTHAERDEHAHTYLAKYGLLQGDLATLSGMTQLRTFSAGVCGYVSDVLAAMVTLTRLTRLDLTLTGDVDIDLAPLRALVLLETLAIVDRGYGNCVNCGAAVSGLSSLRTLTLLYNSDTVSLRRDVPQFPPTLTALDLYRPNTGNNKWSDSDVGWRVLSRLALAHLSIGWRFTAMRLAQLLCGSMPLQTLACSELMPSREMRADVPFTALTELDSEGSWFAFAWCARTFTHLRKLTWETSHYRCTTTRDDGVASFPALTALSIAGYAGAVIDTDTQTLASFVRAPQLRQLKLRNRIYRDLYDDHYQTVAALGVFDKLQSLELVRFPLTPTTLMPRLPELGTLIINSQTMWGLHARAMACPSAARLLDAYPTLTNLECRSSTPSDHVVETMRRLNSEAPAHIQRQTSPF
jgi:hypothetical protein